MIFPTYLRMYTLTRLIHFSDIAPPPKATGLERKILSAAPGGPPAAPGRPLDQRRVKQISAAYFNYAN